MSNFTPSELKKIALQAMGANLNLNQKDEYIAGAEEIINNRISEIITAKGNDVISGVESIGNGASSLVSSANNVIPSSQLGAVQNALPVNPNAVDQLTGITNNIPGAGSIPGLPEVPGIPSTPSIPAIPQVPSISSAIPGGVSLDPVDYIPDVGGVPFKAFIKPLLDKALSKAFSKFNPLSFLEEAQGKLGELQQKTVSGLQGLQQQAQGKLEEAATAAADQVTNSIKSSAADLGNLSKKLVKEGETAKKKTGLYIELFLQRKFATQQFSQRLLDPTVAKTFNEIDNAQ